MAYTKFIVVAGAASPQSGENHIRHRSTAKELGQHCARALACVASAAENILPHTISLCSANQ